MLPLLSDRLPYYYVRVMCATPWTTKIDSNSWLELYNEDTLTTVASKKPNSVDELFFSFWPNETKIYGKLKCKLNGQWTTNSENIVFVPCKSFLNDDVIV